MGTLALLTLTDNPLQKKVSASLELTEPGSNAKLPIIQGHLPSAQLLLKDYERWQSDYKKLRLSVRSRLKKEKIDKEVGLNRHCQNAAHTLSNQMKIWLNSAGFQPIHDALFSLANTADLRLLIRTNTPHLWQLPWQAWSLLERYPQIELALSTSTAQPIERRSLSQLRSNIRILAIQGNRQLQATRTTQSRTATIRPEVDINLLKILLPQDQAELVILEEPDRKTLYDCLWDEKGWDIIFFAGHSSTDWYLNQAGRFFINPNDNLTISELRQALRTANALGLKLAIFNSCDGLGLARNLTDLQIPNIIVMREVIPDPIAQTFIRQLMAALVNGCSLYNSLQQAQTQLKALETQYPCASWLPVLCQTSTAANEPLTWSGLRRALAAEPTWAGSCRTLLVLDALRRLRANLLVRGDREIEDRQADRQAEWERAQNTDNREQNQDTSTEDVASDRIYQKGLEIEDIYIPTDLQLIKEPGENHEQQEKLKKFPDTYRQSEFLIQVISWGKSPDSGGRRLAIVGEPGSGKTSLLQRIGDWLMWEQDSQKFAKETVAIWISLANLKREQTLEDYLLSQWLPRLKQPVENAKKSPNLLQLFVKKWFAKEWFAKKTISGAEETVLQEKCSQGKVWLLLDGVDEMPVRFGNPLSKIIQQIEASSWLANTRIVLTCRINVWEANKIALRGFDVYRNQEFTYRAKYGQVPDQVERFILRWFVHDSEQGKQLRQALDEDGKQRIKDLARNPLRLSLLCRVWEMNGRLPDTKAELYEQFVEAIYQWKLPRFLTGKYNLIEWEEPRFHLDRDKICALNQRLAKLAKRALEGKLEPWLKRQLTEWLEWIYSERQKRNLPIPNWLVSILEKDKLTASESPWQISHSLADAVLSSDLKLALELGWLNQVGVTDSNSEMPVYTFFHPSFHEYFAAQAIAWSDWNYFLEHYTLQAFYPDTGTYRIFEAKWREVILLWFGRTQEKTIDRETLNEPKQLFLKMLWKFQDRCRGFYLYQAQFLAAEALAEFRDCEENFANTIVEEIVNLAVPYFNSIDDFELPYHAVEERARVALQRTDPIRARFFIERQIHRMSKRPQSFGFRKGAAVLLEKIDPGNPIVIDTFLEEMQCAEEKLDRVYARQWLIKAAGGNQPAIETLDRCFRDPNQDEDERRDIAATLAAIATGTARPKAIDAIDYLLERLHTGTNWSDTSYLPDNVEAIVANNSSVKAYIAERLTRSLKILQGNDDNSPFHVGRRIYAAQSLLKISPGNPLAMNTAIELLFNHPYNSDVEDAILDFTRYKLEPIAITSFAQVIRQFNPDRGTFEEKRSWRKILEILEDIAPSHPITIEILKQKIRATKDPWNRLALAECLGKIDPGNSEAIDVLTELTCFIDRSMYPLSQSILHISSAKQLVKIDPDNPNAIRTFTGILQSAHQRFLEGTIKLELNPQTASKYVEKLKESYPENSPQDDILKQVENADLELFSALQDMQYVVKGNRATIVVLTELLQTMQDWFLRGEIAKTLGAIDPGNLDAFNAFVELYQTTQDEQWQWAILNAVYRISKHNLKISDRKEVFVSTLSNLIQNTQSSDLRRRTAETIGKLDAANTLAISTLLNLLTDSTQPEPLSKVLDSLQSILQSKQPKWVMRALVRRCKHLAETHEHYSNKDEKERFEAYLELTWYCTEMLRYPEFLNAWHNRSVFYKFHPTFLLIGLLHFLFACRTRIEIYLRYPYRILGDLASILFRLTALISQFILYGGFILGLPIFIIFRFISWQSRKYLHFDLIATLFKFIAAVLGTILVGILSAIWVILVLGLLVPFLIGLLLIYAIYWLFRRFWMAIQRRA